MSVIMGEYADTHTDPVVVPRFWIDGRASTGVRCSDNRSAARIAAYHRADLGTVVGDQLRHVREVNRALARESEV